ncbi:MAG: protease Do [uncultured bacterium (gcode 4)]|uniref:Protease Do n=1 Tax=uncultured bacterium (gcode 4) TaxID=1234023 RepID=K2G4P0_9BACT|nr:MAG: protease Do [uncultured bacterium (gcode 4)]
MKEQKNILIFTVALTLLFSLFSSLLVYQLLIKNHIPEIYWGGNVPKSVTQIPNDPASVAASRSSLKNLETSVKDLAHKISPSVVSIIISKDVQTYRTDPFGFFQEPSGVVRRKVWGWTWFFVKKNGTIITNKHVVSDPNASYTVITSNNQEFVGKVLAIDPTTDLAVIKATTKDWKELNDTPAVNFVEDSSNVEVGNFVVAIWNALAEFQNTVTFWVISGLWRSIEAWDGAWIWTEQLTGLLQTDAAINPGNSWGPLVNLNDEVVWINTAIAAWANGLWFAIPLSQKEVTSIVNSIEKFWSIKRAFIWIRYISLSPDIAKQLNIKTLAGDYIGSQDWQPAVIQWSPAEKSWLKDWDTIVEINWIPLLWWLTTKDILKDKLPGEKVVLKIITKAWETKTIELILSDR